MDADSDLGWECALGDLAVDGGPGPPGPGEDGLEADDPIWLGHGCVGSGWLLPTAADPDRTGRDGCARAFFVSSQRGVWTAANRRDRRSMHVVQTCAAPLGHRHASRQSPSPRPRPRSRPWLKASSRLSLRPVSKEMPSSILRLARIDSICGSRSRPRAMSPIAERVDL